MAVTGNKHGACCWQCGLVGRPAVLESVVSASLARVCARATVCSGGPRAWADGCCCSSFCRGPPCVPDGTVTLPSLFKMLTYCLRQGFCSSSEFSSFGIAVCLKILITEHFGTTQPCAPNRCLPRSPQAAPRVKCRVGRVPTQPKTRRGPCTPSLPEEAARFPRLPHSGCPELANIRGPCLLGLCRPPLSPGLLVLTGRVQSHRGLLGPAVPVLLRPATCCRRPRRASTLPAGRGRCRFSGSALCSVSSSRVTCPGADSLTVVVVLTLGSSSTVFSSSF